MSITESIDIIDKRIYSIYAESEWRLRIIRFYGTSRDASRVVATCTCPASHLVELTSPLGATRVAHISSVH